MFFKYLIIFLFLVLFNISSAFDNKIDSLENELKKQTDKEKIKTFIALSDEYLNLNREKSIEYAQKALTFSRNFKLQNYEGLAYLKLGVNYGINNKFSQAEDFLTKSVELLEKSKDETSLASAYNAFGNIKKATGDIPTSLDYYKKAIEIREKINDKNGLASSYNNLGVVYYSQGMHEKAIDYYLISLKISEPAKLYPIIISTFQNLGNVYIDLGKIDLALNIFIEALKISQKVGDVYKQGSIYINLGNCYLSLEKFDSSAYYYNEALNLSKNIDDDGLKYIAISNIALLYHRQKKYDKALTYFNEALELAQILKNNYQLASLLNNIGDYYYKIGNFEKAVYFLNESRNISEKNHYKLILKETYFTLSDLYASLGKYKESRDLLKLFNDVKDSIFTSESIKKTAEFEVRHEIEKKDQENLLLRKEKEVERTTQITLLVIILLLIVTSLAIYSRFIYKKKTNAILEQKNTELEKVNLSNENNLQIINYELNKASEYVMSLIPKEISDSLLEINWKFVPSEKLGGDSFGYHKLDESHLAVYLLDVSGHGVGSALHSVSILNTLRFETLPNTDFKNPKSVITSLNSKFQMKQHGSYYFTIWYGVINLRNKEINYICAGHPPPLLISNNHYFELASNNIFIGGIHDFEFKSNIIKYDVPALIYIFSDGVYEVLGPSGEFLSLNSFYDFLKSNYENPKDLEDIYLNSLSLKNNHKLDDDFSLLKIKLK